MDRWCEQRFWDEIGVETGGVEPLSCGTGLVICFVPFIYEPWSCPRSLIFLKVSMVVLGVGTFIYHWIPHEEDHVNSFDWFPMSFTCAVLVYLCVEPSLKIMNELGNFFVLLALVVWSGFLFIGMNQFDYVILNAVLVAPPVLCLAVYTVRGLDTLVVWTYLILSLALWLVNHYACQYWSPLAVLHSLYHVVIGVAIWEAGCLVSRQCGTI